MKGKILGILLSLCLVISLFPLNALAADSGFSDMPTKDHWSYEALSSAVKNGLLEGDNGKLSPQSNLSRAQLATIVNRAFGAQATADISAYTDTAASKWYYADMAKAVRMGTFVGSGGTLRPDASVTRQEAFLVLARAMKLTAGSTAALDAFSDKAEVASWAAPSVAAMVSAGYVEGSGGKLNPTQTITRAEFAQVLNKMVALYISEPGTYTANVTGNVLVRSPNVTLKGLTITGDLILGEGVGSGDVSLDNVTVEKRLVVRAGGENSIHIINNSGIGSIVIGKTGDGGVRVRTEEGCRVDVVYVDDGTDDIILEGSFNQVTVNTDAPVIIKDAKVTGLTVNGKSAEVKLQGTTTVSDTLISAEAAGAKLEVDTGAKAASVQSGAEGVIISGGGTVTQAIVTGNNTAVNTTGTKVTAGEGTTGVTQNGQTVSGSGTPSGGYWNATSVTTYDALKSALTNGSVNELVIEGIIEIPEGDSITFTKPVTIADSTDCLLIISGTLTNESKLINKGLGGVNNDTGMQLEGSFVNNGSFTNESRFGMFEGSFVNNGTVNNKSWLHCCGTEITNNKTFNNTGDITLLNSDDLNSSFSNASDATLISETPDSFQVYASCSFTNAGTTTINGYFDSYGTLTNTGSFTYTGHLMTAGSVTGTLTKGTGGELETNITVTTLAELKAQLASLSAGFDGIVIGDEITQDGDLDVSRHVRIGPDGTLIVPADKTLTVTSTEGYNGLDVSGKFDLYGNLVTTRSGSGEDECVGQLTLLYGALSAYDDYTIVNGGVILYIGGEIQPDDILVGGNPITNYHSNVSVSTEAELRSAMTNANVDQIVTGGDIELTESLDITKTMTVGCGGTGVSDYEAYSFIIPTGKTVSVKSGGSLNNLGSIVNNGTVEDTSAANGVFSGSLASITNNGTLNIDNIFLVLEGTLTNNGLIRISAGDGHILLCPGSVITNNSGGTINDNGSMNLEVSTGWDGALYDRGATFTNAGAFNVGSISTPASDAYFGSNSGTVTNTGSFVANGNTDLKDTAFTHSGGTFDVYNSSGLTITGGSFTITDDADEGSFTNNGYMRVVDQYGRSDGNHICAVSLAENSIADNSNWLEYIAEVYSADGFAAADTAQQEKIDALDAGGTDYFGFGKYNRMDFMSDLTLTGTVNLDSFNSYWVNSYPLWNSETGENETITAHVTIGSGATATIGRQCSFNVFGVLVNNGTLVTAARFDDDVQDIHEDCGRLEVWSEGTLTNNGTLTNDGEITLRHEFMNADDTVKMATATGLGSVTPRFVAEVHNADDFIAANSSSTPSYNQIEIKGDSIVDLERSVTVSRNLYIEPGSGLIVEHGATLTFNGSGCGYDNNGDTSVYGTLLITNGATLCNRQNLDIGAVSGSETALVMLGDSAGATGSIINENNITVYATGTLNAYYGSYSGSVPTGAGTYTSPAAPG